MAALIIGIVCSVVTVLVTLGTYSRWKRSGQSPKPVTIVVCARNEEQSLFPCLMSLASQDYPDEKLRVILVNHLSTDQTGEIMDAFAESAPFPVEVIHITESDPVYKGKIHALIVALDRVQTEIVIQTDADCVVPETWVRSLISHFREDVVAVGGMVSVGEDSEPKSWVARLQNVDHRYFMGFLGGLSGNARLLSSLYGEHDSKGTPGYRRRRSLFYPNFVSGNNVAFRMEAYREVGGYRGLGPTLIEDYAIMHRMVHRTGKHLAFLLDPESRIQTVPLVNPGELWRQKRRWATATRTADFFSILLFGLVGACRVVLPWFLFIQPTQALIGLLLVAAGSAFAIRRVSWLTKDRIRWRDILFHEVYQILLNHALLFATVVRWPVHWKGERYPAGR